MTFKLGNIPILCPKSQSQLFRDGDRLISADADCRLAYPIVDSIPCMIVEQATHLSLDEWQRIVDQHRANPAAD